MFPDKSLGMNPRIQSYISLLVYSAVVDSQGLLKGTGLINIKLGF